jgi:hypothetical protein
MTTIPQGNAAARAGELHAIETSRSPSGRLSWHKHHDMKSRLWITLALLAIGACSLSTSAQAGERKKNDKISEGAYYEFRGHVSDRDTLQRTFTLGWDKGSQLVTVTPSSALYRYGKAAKLEEVKAGDAVRGVGQAIKGKLIALAAAFGAEGVELPLNVKVPASITLPPPGG